MVEIRLRSVPTLAPYRHNRRVKTPLKWGTFIHKSPMSGQADNSNKSGHKNPLQQAKFLLSSPDLAHLPPDRGAEVAFAGRSNAGKSSALNALCAQKSLARTSKTPGRTQQLVFFTLDENRRLVDLPGYGYAKVPYAVQENWQETLDAYLSTRECLNGLVLLMDSRHPLKEFDLQMLDWCHFQQMPVLVLLTKVDKLSRGPAQATLLKVRQACQTYPLCRVALFSATRNDGVAEARKTIAAWLDDLHN